MQQKPYKDIGQELKSSPGGYRAGRKQDAGVIDDVFTRYGMI